MRIQGDGQGEVGHGSGSINGDLVWIFMGHANHEVGGVFGGGLGRGSAIGHGGDFVGTMDGMAMGEIPCALIDDFAVERFPLGDVLLGTDERKDGAGNDRDIRAADDFHQAKGVLNFFVAPGVAGEHGDAEDIGFWRIYERENRLQIGAAGASGVLIDDDFAFALGADGQSKKDTERQEQGGAVG